MIQFDKSVCTGGRGIVRPTMYSKDNFARMSSCSIGQLNCKKNNFLKNRLVMLKHMFFMPINNLKAILKFKNTHSSPGTHSRIQNRCNRPEFPPSQFFPRGKNGPAHSFPGEKIGRPILSPPSQFFPPH